MVRLLRILPILALAGLATMSGMPAAQARVFVGVGIGVPAYPAYYPPPVYYPPPPVYYAPPPVVYTPPPVVYTPPPATYTYTPPAPNPAPTVSETCRTYNGNATIDASGKPFYGTACLGPDGRWHISQ